MMMLWPAMALGGFLLLTGLVIAMGASSTARYEFERNRVPAREAVAVGPAGSGGACGGFPSDRGGIDAGRSDRHDGAAAALATAVSVARHPAGKRAAARAPETGWWLVDASDDGEGDSAAPLRTVAGPFPARFDAEWAAVSGALLTLTPVRTVHGVRGPGGALVRRPSPQEQSWLAELGDELDGLADDWDPLLSDTDALATLVTEVTAALVDAGLGVHDCDGRRNGGAPAGGVCLTPAPDSGGILVVWRSHDRLSGDLARGADAEAGVQRVMNSAIAGVLDQLGFGVEPVSGTGCHLVTASHA